MEKFNAPKLTKSQQREHARVSKKGYLFLAGGRGDSKEKFTTPENEITNLIEENSSLRNYESKKLAKKIIKKVIELMNRR